MKNGYIKMMALAAVAAVSCLGLQGCSNGGSKALFAKAKAAQKAGNVNFFGFYTGMPLEDATALVAHYGLEAEENGDSLEVNLGRSMGLLPDGRFDVNLETHEVYRMLFSLKDLRAITKGGDTFEKLAQAVANQVGDLKGIQNGYEFQNIDGVSVSLYELSETCLIVDAPRARKARDARERAEKAALLAEEKQREEELKNLLGTNAQLLGKGTQAGETKTIMLPGGVPMEMVWCPPGTFMMGSPESERGRDDDETLHQVTLTKGFWMAKTEVTQKQWKSVMGSEDDPSFERGDNLPMHSFKWDGCQQFCEKTGLQLPTEAQWEYACRAGSTGPYAGTGVLDDMGWYMNNSGGDMRPVGMLQPNAWGLYDMHGNVSEWCSDRYGDYPSSAVTDPTGASSGEKRVVRGGAVNDFFPFSYRSAKRAAAEVGTAFGYLGFRPVSNLSGK